MDDFDGVTNKTAIVAAAVVSILLLCNVLVQAAALTKLGEVAKSAKGVEVRAGGIEEKIPVRWEYDVVSIPDGAWNTKAQQLGNDGWEIVSARRASDAEDNFAYECIVKRANPGV